MIFLKQAMDYSSEHRQAIDKAYRMDEATCVNQLISTLDITKENASQIKTHAIELVEEVRKKQAEESTGIETLMMHYDLSTEEGIMLMCLAEALLRIPDKETEDLLIRDKLTSANWEKHIGMSESSFVKMATWGLALTGKVLETPKKGYFNKIWKDLLRRGGEPVIRQAVREAIKVMSQQFVLGRDIKEALKNSKRMIEKGYSYSYDMLGEVARTQKDADRYFQAYKNAIEQIGNDNHSQDLFHGPSISVKLSALHPRYEFNQQEKVIPALTQRLKELTLLAKKYHISLTVDAEETDRLEMSLDIFANVFCDAEFKDWSGLGLAVQAYQKRAFPVLQWLIDLARQRQRRIQVRLVKGAYWDSEIKLSQVSGFAEYPVFTRKASTDVSYWACAKLMLSAQDAIYSQFATHNAYSVAAILNMIGDNHSEYNFEFQNLQGMGKALHDQIVDKDKLNVPCRIYAPVGSHEELLPYLVRRLLENGANSSFVNKIADKKTPIETLVENPIEKVMQFNEIRNSKIPLPKDIYGAARLNSAGIDVSHHSELNELSAEMAPMVDKQWQAVPLHRKAMNQDSSQVILNPADHRQQVGTVIEATPEDVENALKQAKKAYSSWSGLAVEKRADIIRRASDLLEKHRAELLTLAIREAGKTLLNAINEVREAVDFCRYYALQAETILAPTILPGPTGESNILRLRGRGVIVCVSPWNFPVAIFTGQVAAALVAGNTVIAKPAEQTALTAARIVELFYEAGVPEEVLQFLPGRGETVGAALIKDPRINGVVFTGSTDTAKIIQKSLAEHHAPIVPFIAETGGVNAMIVDSTALPEQLIFDVLGSSFDSAGQRCSALRVMFLQEEIADRVIEMLQGAMAEISVGDPMLLSTDVGPVIDKDAQSMLAKHAAKLRQQAKLIHAVEMPSFTQHGTFIAPQAYELPNLEMAKREVFGPILHVIRYRLKDLDNVIDSINGLDYGLTFGIQSRIQSTVDYIQERIRAGNIYVNRNIIGAVVGVQPFGGRGLSGTGPKAGGPHYLPYLCTESTLTVNTTATGGNATLMAMEDD